MGKKDQKKAREHNVGGPKLDLQYNDVVSLVFKMDEGISTATCNGVTQTFPLSRNIVYHGENKTRPLVSIPLLQERYLDIVEAMLHFDVICCVDTSYSSKEFTSVGVITLLREVKLFSSNNLNGSLNAYCMLDRHEMPPRDFEQMNWMRALDWLRSDGVQRKIMMIVDSDYDNLGFYNERSKPVYEGRYLPEDALLVYSSDRSREMWTNGMIIETDKECKRIKDMIEKGNYDYSTRTLPSKVTPAIVKHTDIRRVIPIKQQVTDDQNQLNESHSTII